MGETMADQFAEHQRVVAQAAGQAAALEAIADRIIQCFEHGGKLYVFGNGGSAADAQHIAAELVGRFKQDRRALPAVAMTTDSSILTAIANDIGAERCFERQVQALVTDRDAVWALSVSGRSPNVLLGLDAAIAAGALRIGFSSRTGDEMKQRCDLWFEVNHDTSDRVQEVHQLAYHLICDRIERHYA